MFFIYNVILKNIVALLFDCCIFFDFFGFDSHWISSYLRVYLNYLSLGQLWFGRNAVAWLYTNFNFLLFLYLNSLFMPVLHSVFFCECFLRCFIFLNFDNLCIVYRLCSLIFFRFNLSLVFILCNTFLLFKLFKFIFFSRLLLSNLIEFLKTSKINKIRNGFIESNQNV